MNTKHTPGPWHAVGLDIIAGIPIKSLTYVRCKEINAPDDPGAAEHFVGIDEAHANAALIAAAPHIETALEGLLIAVNDSLTKAEPKVIAAMQEARAAIEEATK